MKTAIKFFGVLLTLALLSAPVVDSYARGAGPDHGPDHRDPGPDPGPDLGPDPGPDPGPDLGPDPGPGR
jgi:hypothetical protein